jgi:hypothetical protein
MNSIRSKKFEQKVQWDAASAAPRVGTARRGFNALDALVADLYRTGIVQSIIVHTVLLLALALTLIGPDTRTVPVRLAIDFSRTAQGEVDLQSDELLMPTDKAASSNVEQAEIISDRLLAETDAVNVGDVQLVSLVADAPPVEPDVSDLVGEVPHAARPARPANMPKRIAATVGRGGQSEREGGVGGGFGGEMGRRLAAAGAKTGDVQISIAWDSVDDIDVHVMVEPLAGGSYSMISWMNRRGLCGGFLDVDANANHGMLTRTPVENIFWAKGLAPYGRYTVAIHHFRSWSGQARMPVDVAVLVDEEVKRFRPVATVDQPLTMVTTFDRRPSQ